MGATDFTNVYRGPLSMTEAYSELVSQALWEHGHDPYNGTISTTSGVMQDPGVRAAITADQATAHLVEWWDREERPMKWEAAWAIPLLPEPPVVRDPNAPDDRFAYLRPDNTQPGWLFYGMAAC